jgi:hypothetical protein
LATDKKGGGLEDLKARLGLDTVLSRARPAEPKAAAQPPGTAPGAAGPPGSQPGAGGGPPGAAAGSAPGAVPAPPERPPGAEFAASVSTFEEPAAGEGDASPVYSATHDLVDPSLAAPMSRATRNALIGAVVGMVLLALAAGFGFGKAMREREVANAAVEAADQVLRQMRPIADRLGQLQQALAAQGSDYSPELQQVLQDAFEGTGPVLTTRTLADARVLMTAGEDLAQQLITYATSTQVLQAMGQEHLRKTIADQSIIDRLQAATAEAQNYAVVFDSDQLIRNYRAYFCTNCPTCHTCEGQTSPDQGGVYVPTQGHVVTYDNLDITTTGEGDTQVSYYTVQWGGQPRQVEIYNLLAVSADQLVANPNEETALDRYRARVGAIRTYLETVLRLQEQLMTSLQAQAARATHFTI